jgi:4-hydroxy-4-methyl-2-oxoglutarate aldolase
VFERPILRALFGCLSAEALAIKGVRGYTVDGGCRDVQAVVDQGFPVFARFHTPIDIICAWRAEPFGEAIAVGGLQVQPDDDVLADRDGIILVGAGDVEAVVAAAERKMSTEGEMARAIRAGEDPQAAYLRYRVF